MSLWLQKMGASVAGYALPPGPGESLFELASVSDSMRESVYADIRDLDRLTELIRQFQPEVVFHLAAQPLVRLSYQKPVETYHVNVMGAVNILDAVRINDCCRVAVIITSDKCYENNEWVWGYRENDALGGYDPYSSSKGCVELITTAYRHSFFEGPNSKEVAVASARAGNVIGGGDFSKDRLVPDVMAAVLRHESVRVRSPDAIRPWQHVLEPLSGYLLLAERLWDSPNQYSQSWNFGPAQEDARSVRWMLNRLNEHWTHRVAWKMDSNPAPHEARLLTLDSAKARAILGWKPRWTLDRALEAVVDWWQEYEIRKPLREVVMRQIDSYESASATEAS
jgi:CDP-glucose 4,6-dehydratase